MPEFCTFLVFRPSEIDLIHSICADANWATHDISDPSSRYFFTENSIFVFAQASALKDCSLPCNGQQHGRLLILEAEQAETDNIVQLICAANIILEGFPDKNSPTYSPPTHGFPLPNVDAERERIFENVFRTDVYFQQFTYRETLPVSVAVAARAWKDKKIVYAIHKLAHSYQTESVTPWSMHPRHGQVFEKHTDDFASHVGTSVAINLAYSAIEELGLAVGASRDKPRSIEKHTFAWNPEVLKPLENRLKRAGIDPTRTVDWVTRGEKTEVEIYEMLNSLADHSDGLEIRDRQVPLPDAINFCEYLRSRMTAHAFSYDTPRLGPYEVYNTQQVARFLILSKCNLWNTWTEDLRKRYS